MRMRNIQELLENLQRQQQVSNLLFQHIQSFLQQGYPLHEIEKRLNQEYPNDGEIVKDLITKFQKGLDCHLNGHKFEKMKNGNQKCNHCGLIHP